MTQVIMIHDQITPAWLTTRLQGAGILRESETVLSVRSKTNEEAFNSTIIHLDLTYSSSVSATVPRQMVLKLNSGENGELEVWFYQLAAPFADQLPMLLSCYDAVYDAANGCSHILLKDVSATHAPPVTRQATLACGGVPTDQCLEEIVTTLAQFHAYWWQHPCLGTGVGQVPVRPWFSNATTHAQHVQRRRREWDAFLSSVGDEFPAPLRQLYEQALPALPVLWERYLKERVTTFASLTLCNGDSYLAQFLCPIQQVPGTYERVYLIDFQAMSANFGAFDLAYLFSTFWTSAQRQEQNREERLLRLYHQTLVQAGIEGYSWDDLHTDYRLMVCYMLFDPIADQTAGAKREYWWPKLHCLASAFQDLGCLDLLK
jgi:hypothetical protein